MNKRMLQLNVTESNANLKMTRNNRNRYWILRHAIIIVAIVLHIISVKGINTNSQRLARERGSPRITPTHRRRLGEITEANENSSETTNNDSNAILEEDKNEIDKQNQLVVEYEREFPYDTICPYFEARPNVKIALAYHVGMFNNWKNVLQDQLQSLHQCGLGHSASQLLLSYAAGKEKSDASEIIDLMKPYNFSFQIEGVVNPQAEPWGGDLVNTVHDYCQDNEDAVVYYFHNFGVERYDPKWRSNIDQEYSYSRVLYWRKMMEYFTLEQPHLCLDAILRDDGDRVDACGTNLYTWPQSYYSGNFWVASCSYLATIPPFRRSELNPHDWLTTIADQLWIGGQREGKSFSSLWQPPELDISGFNRHWLQPSEYRSEVTINQQEQIHHEYYHDAPTSPPRPHPHAGAKDADGNWGYVANVTHLRQWMIQKYCHDNSDKYQTSCTVPFTNPLEFEKVCEESPDVNSEAWDVLANRVQVSDPLTSDDKEMLLPKVLCAVYTYEGHHDHIRGIAETWGWKCDGFLAASTKTTQTFDNSDTANFSDEYNPPLVEMINLPHEGLEVYGNMWQKTRSILGYMHDNYLNDFDYFYVVGDDTHLIVENLKSFLLEHRFSEKPFFSGMITGPSRVDGGGGYVMSRSALQKFVSEAIHTCEVHAWSSMEDYIISSCMGQIGINVTDPADHEGKQRFFRDGPDSTCFQSYMQPILEMWGEKHGYKSGRDLISKSTIAFHQIKGVAHMKRHHATLYQTCPSGTALADALLVNRLKRAIT